MIVTAVREARGLRDAEAMRDAQLLSVGSVVHFARPDAVVWGSGINAKAQVDESVVRTLDVRAVRGPLTRDHLRERSVEVPAVYGDPALLIGRLWPALLETQKSRPVTIVPNLNDASAYRRHRYRLDTRSSVAHCLRTIAASELVVGSSLHGIIVAEALGVPARLVRSRHEPTFKYADYYLGTGRPEWRASESVDAARALGGETPPVDWDPEPLLDAFPADLWRRSGQDASRGVSGG